MRSAAPKELQPRCVVLHGAAQWDALLPGAADLRERLSARDAEAKELDEKFRRAITELATLSANAANFDERESLRMAAEDSMKKEFAVTGAKVLEAAQKTFMERAVERLTVSEDKSEARI